MHQQSVMYKRSKHKLFARKADEHIFLSMFLSYSIRRYYYLPLHEKHNYPERYWCTIQLKHCQCWSSLYQILPACIHIDFVRVLYSLGLQTIKQSFVWIKRYFTGSGNIFFYGSVFWRNYRSVGNFKVSNNYGRNRFIFFKVSRIEIIETFVSSKI